MNEKKFPEMLFVKPATGTDSRGRFEATSEGDLTSFIEDDTAEYRLVCVRIYDWRKHEKTAE